MSLAWFRTLKSRIERNLGTLAEIDDQYAKGRLTDQEKADLIEIYYTVHPDERPQPEPSAPEGE